MSYDSKCHDLAAWFLPEDLPSPQAERLLAELAQHIQDAIEDWLACEKTTLDGIMEEMTNE